MTPPESSSTESLLGLSAFRLRPSQPLEHGAALQATRDFIAKTSTFAIASSHRVGHVTGSRGAFKVQVHADHLLNVHCKWTEFLPGRGTTQGIRYTDAAQATDLATSHTDAARRNWQSEIASYHLASLRAGFDSPRVDHEVRQITPPLYEETACRTCTGAGKLQCGTCNGRGTNPCGCGGRGQHCDSCGGSSTLRVWVSSPSANAQDGYYENRSCHHCSGGYQRCPNCGNTNRLKCKPCSASGSIRCKPCEGQGMVHQYGNFLLTHTVRNTYGYTADPEDQPTIAPEFAKLNWKAIYQEAKFDDPVAVDSPSPEAAGQVTLAGLWTYEHYTQEINKARFSSRWHGNKPVDGFDQVIAATSESESTLALRQVPPLLHSAVPAAFRAFLPAATREFYARIEQSPHVHALCASDGSQTPDSTELKQRLRGDSQMRSLGALIELVLMGIALSAFVSLISVLFGDSFNAYREGLSPALFKLTSPFLLSTLTQLAGWAAIHYRLAHTVGRSAPERHVRALGFDNFYPGLIASFLTVSIAIPEALLGMRRLALALQYVVSKLSG